VTDYPFNQPTQPTITEPKRPSIARRILGFLGSVLQTVVFAVILFLVVNMITARIRVEGDSMEPSLIDGQFVVVNKLAYSVLEYSIREPQRGDIVVFNFPLNPARRFIKRIIALPGDRLQVLDGQVFINGNLLNEPYLAVPPAYNNQWDVGMGEVFVLGDNRNNSSDSQNWGPLAMEDIIGKAIFVYWPTESMGWIPHYDLAAAADEG